MRSPLARGCYSLTCTEKTIFQNFCVPNYYQTINIFATTATGIRLHMLCALLYIVLLMCCVTLLDNQGVHPPSAPGGNFPPTLMPSLLLFPLFFVFSVLFLFVDLSPLFSQWRSQKSVLRHRVIFLFSLPAFVPVVFLLLFFFYLFSSLFRPFP